MALDTYANLKTAIANWLDRDDLTDNIDDFIDLCEARNNQEIHVPDGTVLPPILLQSMLSRSALTVDARYVALPSGFMQAKILRLLTDPVTVLTEIPLFEMTRYRKETTGKPQFFTVHETIEFDVAPDSSYSGEIVFYDDLASLDDSNTTNALLTAAPNVYLYGSLAAAAPFLQHDERVALWDGQYIAARRGLAGSERRKRHIGPQIARVAGARP